MAKRRTKVLQARKSDVSRDDDDSLLIQSAESLGRIIGSLQRQVQGSAQRVSTMAEDAFDALPTDVIARGRDLIERGTRSQASGGAKAPGSRPTSASSKSAGARKSPRKTAASRKRAGSRKTGGTRKASAGRKTSRARKTARTRKSSRNKA